MAENRGGRRTPRDKTPVVSGPGRFARRTDGRQPIDVPNVQESTDLQQGDRQRLVQGLRSTGGLPRAARPRVAPPPAGGGPLPSSGGGALSPLVFQGESTRPGEPLTEGASFGPGAGPEALQMSAEPQNEREVVLAFLANTLGDNGALNMLNEERAARMPQPQMPQRLSAAPAPAESPAAPAEGEPELEAIAFEEEETVEEPMPEEAPV